jgi:hypothetical protein
VFPAFVSYMIHQPIANTLYERGGSINDEQLFGASLRDSVYWYDDIQFLTRNVNGSTILSKQSRDPKWDIFKSGVAYNYSAADIKTGRGLLDAHVGYVSKEINHKGPKKDWGVYRKLLELVLWPGDPDWEFVDGYKVKFDQLG